MLPNAYADLGRPKIGASFVVWGQAARTGDLCATRTGDVRIYNVSNGRIGLLADVSRGDGQTWGRLQGITANGTPAGYKIYFGSNKDRPAPDPNDWRTVHLYRHDLHSNCR